MTCASSVVHPNSTLECRKGSDEDPQSNRCVRSGVHFCSLIESIPPETRTPHRPRCHLAQFRISYTKVALNTNWIYWGIRVVNLRCNKVVFVSLRLHPFRWIKYRRKPFRIVVWFRSSKRSSWTFANRSVCVDRCAIQINKIVISRARKKAFLTIVWKVVNFNMLILLS